ncbi:MAG: NADH-quinone oxidoreductase subunit C [Bacteroidota bacterium]
MSSLNQEFITEKLQSEFGSSIQSIELLQDILTVTVEKSSLKSLVKFLHDDESLNFHFLTTLCGLHFPEQAMPFGMMYQLHNMPANVRIRIKTFLNDSEPVFDSLTDIWPAANWQERETYDFFGYRFHGHPDMRRILNMDSLVGWPLRKEFPLEDPFRGDKDDKMFGR